MGSIDPWQALQRSSCMCAVRSCRRVGFDPRFAGFSLRGGTSLGGGGGGEHKRRLSTHWPLRTGELRVGIEVTVSTPACDRRPKRNGGRAATCCISGPFTTLPMAFTTPVIV